MFYSFPNSPSHMARELPEETPSDLALAYASDEEPGEDEFPGRREITSPTTSRVHSLRRRAWRGFTAFLTAFNEFMTVPLWAAFASLIVACVRPLQHGLEEHFPPVKNALTAAGQCSIPVTLIVLGAYFYRPTEDASKFDRTARDEVGRATLKDRMSTASMASLVGSVRGMFKLGSMRGPKERGAPTLMDALQKDEKTPGETKTVFVAVVSRMIVVPLLLLPGMALSAKTDWHQVLEE